MKHERNSVTGSKQESSPFDRTAHSINRNRAIVRSRKMIASALPKIAQINTSIKESSHIEAKKKSDHEDRIDTGRSDQKEPPTFKKIIKKIYERAKLFDVNELWAGPKAWRGKPAGNYWVTATDFVRMVTYFRTGGASASITYYFLLALFPLLALIVGLAASLAQNTFLSLSPDAIETIQKLIPAKVIEALGDVIGNMTFSMSFATLSVTVLVALWASSQGFGQMFNRVVRIYPRRKGTIAVPPRVIGFISTLFFILLLVITTFLLSFGNVFFNFINNHFRVIKISNTVINLLTYGLGFGLLLFMFFMLYYSAARRNGQNLKSFPGALFASLGWILLTTFYSLYISYKANLSTIYGGFLNIIILLIWLKMCCQIILFGALVNYLATWQTCRKDYGSSLMDLIEEQHLDTEPTDLFALDDSKKQENRKTESKEKISRKGRKHNVQNKT